MTCLAKVDDIVVLHPSAEDRVAGAEYAAVTLPWTFNRMMYNTGSRGQQGRGLNIAKGIVAQEVLKQKLAEMGSVAKTQRKSHRDEDLFDFRVDTPEGQLMLDLKSWHYYTDYESIGREPLTPELIFRAADYPGPDWRQFFPMLVPHTQINQPKQAYCFAIASSIDIRHNPYAGRSDFRLTAYPYGSFLPFLSSKQLCIEREMEGVGINLELSWNPTLLDPKQFRIKLLAEHEGDAVSLPLTLRAGAKMEVGPLSCLESLQIEKDQYDQWTEGRIDLAVSKNGLGRPVLNTARRNLNTEPSGELSFVKEDFCNLILPDDFCLYFIGWSMKDDFLAACRKYEGWVWPNDRANKYLNQPWSQVTESDLRTLERTGFADCVTRNPTRLSAGWLKTTGSGGGACCYVYPNIGRQGGVKETNLYALPVDLQILAELGAS